MTLVTGALAKRPSLATTTRKQGGDGFAYAGRLLERALAGIKKEQPPVYALGPGSRTLPTIAEQVRFIRRVGLAQLRASDGWWLFNHVGIAQAQNLLRSAILESMRRGLACIGEAMDAAAVVDGQTGILVNQSDPKQLAAAIVDLLTKLGMRSRYGVVGKKRFEDEFTFERYCDRLRVTLESAFA